jgi:ABC-type oligopeptide transport system substrate-binding subunit
MPQATPLLPGDPERLGAYELTGRLGEGGQGMVFLGTAPADDPGDGGPGVPVAVKLLHARLSTDAKARSRFAAEVAVAQRVAPFCTAPILDADVEGDTPYIVSEYIDGPSLQDVVSRQGPRTGTALHRLAVGTITALTAIHQAGVVHRDLKPSNVLLAADGPRVIDFGIARALDATGTLSSTAIGTPAYMAPEQISGTAVGPAADVFAWGCTMAFAAGGRPPFGQDSIPAVMNRIVNLPPDLSMLGSPLRELVAQCLVKDPSARPSAQAVLLRLLGHADAGPATPQAPASVLTEGVRAAAHAEAPPQMGQPAWPAQMNPPHMAPPQPAPPPYLPLGTPYGPAPPRPQRPRTALLAGAGTAAFVALVVLGTFAFIQLWPAGGGGTTTPTPAGGRTGGTLRMAATYPPEAIDPSNATFGPDVFIAKQLFTGLTEIDPAGRVVRRLAQDLRPDATCRSWTVNVRQGTTFSNGEPVDPQAFARGWNRAARASNGYAIFVMDGIKGFAEVRDGKADTLAGVRTFPTSLQVDLTRPDCEFDRRLATVPFYPVPASAGDVKNKSYNNSPIGNGPFQVVSYTANSKITLARNERWYAGRTKLDGVDINLSPGTGPVTAFDAGEYDWAVVNTNELSTVGARHGNDGRLLNHNVNGLDFLVPVTARGPLASRPAREAVSYAIDRQALNQTLFGGVRTPATGIVPPTLPGFRRTGICPSCERADPAKARQLAAQAGLPSGSAVTLVMRENSSTTQSAEAIVRQLESVLGWKITQRRISLTEFDDFANALTGKDATGLGHFGWVGDHASAHDFLHSLVGAGQTARVSDWRNAQFDSLLSQAIATRDEASRNRLLQQAEKMALDDLALIPLWVRTETRLANTAKFTGLRMDYDGDPTLATAALR